MRTSQIANLVRVSHRNMKGRFGRLLNTDTGLGAAPQVAWRRSVDRRWGTGSSRAFCIILVDAMGIRNSSRLLLRLGHCGTNHHLLLLRRHWGGILSGGIVIRYGTERTEGIVYGFETSGLSDEPTRTTRRSRGRRRCGSGGGLQGGFGLRGRLGLGGVGPGRFFDVHDGER